jgi:integrase
LRDILERRRTTLKPRSFIEVSHHLRKQSAPLAKLRVPDIDRRVVATLLAKIETDSGPTARNRTRASLSAFFNFAIAEGVVSTNPVQGTLKANEGGSRERVLTQEELRTLWRALADPSIGAFAGIVKLLLLTGARRTEIGGL